MYADDALHGLEAASGRNEDRIAWTVGEGDKSLADKTARRAVTQRREAHCNLRSVCKRGVTCYWIRHGYVSDGLKADAGVKRRRSRPPRTTC